jgi:heat shock protein HtpX
MWEAIASNRFRSRVLIVVMGAVLVLLGFAVGAGTSGEPQVGGTLGVVAALVVWLFLWLLALSQGNRILLASVGAREIEKADAPQLWNIVEEMTIAAGLPAMPRVYLIEESAPNAFAVGRTPETAAVAVTSGLLARLDRDELQGVVAHEIGHIHNLDIRFMTLAAVMMGAVVLISDLFLRSLRHTGGRFGSSGKKSGGGILIIIAVVAAIVAPICAQLLYFACSRRREFLADAAAAQFTRYPEGLASALEKIASRADRMTAHNRAVAPLFIISPLRAHSNLLSTHPATEIRVKILREMAGAGYADYEGAYAKIAAGKSNLIGARTLGLSGHLAAREPSAPPQTKADAIERARTTADILTRLGGFVPFECACGLKIKTPPHFKDDSVQCPRCGRQNAIPRARHQPSGAPPGKSNEPLFYARGGKGWEAFQCGCGGTVQLSPSFRGRFLRCPQCNRRIEVMTEGT